ncbi:hypothetical protein DH2020_029573 [Rehmannia glutinosa]|uniref:Uncharacterized protein n=1 Tax=Rehmannia glutinosa TaxID=99300 RepID=A0ABR0VQQ9_REHGL
MSKLHPRKKKTRDFRKALSCSPHDSRKSTRAAVSARCWLCPSYKTSRMKSVEASSRRLTHSDYQGANSHGYLLKSMNRGIGTLVLRALNILKDYVRFGLEHWGSDSKAVKPNLHQWTPYSHSIHRQENRQLSSPSHSAPPDTCRKASVAEILRIVSQKLPQTINGQKRKRIRSDKLPDLLNAHPIRDQLLRARRIDSPLLERNPAFAAYPSAATTPESGTAITTSQPPAIRWLISNAPRFVHGFPEDDGVWEREVNMLEDAGFRLGMRHQAKRAYAFFVHHDNFAWATYPFRLAENLRHEANAGNRLEDVIVHRHNPCALLAAVLERVECQVAEAGGFGVALRRYRDGIFERVTWRGFGGFSRRRRRKIRAWRAAGEARDGWRRRWDKGITAAVETAAMAIGVEKISKRWLVLGNGL